MVNKARNLSKKMKPKDKIIIFFSNVFAGVGKINLSFKAIYELNFVGRIPPAAFLLI
jgi:hypothetical protein